MRVLTGLVLMLALFASVTLLSACHAPDAADHRPTTRLTSYGVDRIDDPARSVTCYVYRGFGISCVGMLPGDDE